MKKIRETFIHLNQNLVFLPLILSFVYFWEMCRDALLAKFYNTKQAMTTGKEGTDLIWRKKKEKGGDYGKKKMKKKPVLSRKRKLSMWEKERLKKEGDKKGFQCGMVRTFQIPSLSSVGFRSFLTFRV